MRIDSRTIPVIVILGAIIAILLPLCFMVYGSLVPSFVSTKYTLSYLLRAFTSPRLPGLVLNTVEFGLGGSLLAVALVTPYTWLVWRTDIPAKRFLRLLPTIPLAIPILVESFAWVFLLSPNIGLINFFINRTLGLGFLHFNIFSIWGMTFAWGMSAMPLVYLVVEAPMQSLDSSMEEASKVAGAKTLRTMIRVTFPIILPAIISAFLLGAVTGVEDLSYPLILGTPAHIPTLATTVYNLATITGQWNLASAYGIVFLILTMVLVTIYVFFTRKSSKFVAVTGKANQQIAMPLGRGRWLALVYCLTIFSVAIVLPVAMMVGISLVPFYSVTGTSNPFAQISLANYAQAFQLPLFKQATLNTIGIAISTGLGATILGTIASYGLVKSRIRGKKILEYLSTLPIGIPGIVFAVGLIWIFLLTPGLKNIYGTIYLMAIGLIIVYLPYAIRFMSSTLLQLSNELEESSSVCGAGWLYTFWHVVLPLLKSAFVNSFTYVMANAFRDITTVVLLSSGSSIVLMVMLLSTYESTSAALPVVAAFSVIIMIILALMIGIVRFISWLFRSRARDRTK